MSECEEDIHVDQAPTIKNKNKGLKTHCFRCCKNDHVLKHCHDLKETSVNIRTLGYRFKHFVDNHCFRNSYFKDLSKLRLGFSFLTNSFYQLLRTFEKAYK